MLVNGTGWVINVARGYRSDDAWATRWTNNNGVIWYHMVSSRFLNFAPLDTTSRRLFSTLFDIYEKLISISVFDLPYTTWWLFCIFFNKCIPQVANLHMLPLMILRAPCPQAQNCSQDQTSRTEPAVLRPSRIAWSPRSTEQEAQPCAITSSSGISDLSNVHINFFICKIHTP